MANSKQESKNCYCNVKLISMVNHFNGIFSLFCTNAESKQWKIYGSKMQEFHRQNNKICNSWETFSSKQNPYVIQIDYQLLSHGHMYIFWKQIDDVFLIQWLSMITIRFIYKDIMNMILLYTNIVFDKETDFYLQYAMTIAKR